MKSGFTLVEIVLVMAILVAIAGLAIPNLMADIERERLPGSAEQMRSLIAMVRARAALDGVRYRIRFPLEDEFDDEESPFDPRQPMIEREADPVLQPEVYTHVTEPWALGTFLREGIRCAEVRLGRPNILDLREREFRSEVQDVLERAFEDFDPIRPPLIIEPDGRCEWVTFVITNAPEDIEPEELADSDEFRSIEIIVDGFTGTIWLQRPLYEEELDLFEEEGWPIILRQDFLDPRVLTEEDVLELHDIPLDQMP